MAPTDEHGTSRKPDSTERGVEPAGTTNAVPDERRTLTLRLPLVTLSLSRPAGAATRVPSPSGVGTATTEEVAGGQRLLFYAGIAALGAVGAVEWPVAAAIAAGTYLAAKSRSASASPDGPTPVAAPPAVPAP